MFTYDPATGVMFTCDAFGMHYCSQEPFDVDVAAIMPHYRWVVAMLSIVCWRVCVGGGRGNGSQEPFDVDVWPL